MIDSIFGGGVVLMSAPGGCCASCNCGSNGSDYSSGYNTGYKEQKSGAAGIEG